MIKDTLQISTRSMTPEGYLQGVATLTCVGIQDYYGCEIKDLTDAVVKPDKLYSVFRPPETVFADVTKSSARLKPITDQHPLDGVNARNHRMLSIGTTGENPVDIGTEALAFPFIITDDKGVEKVKAGTHQLSMGYDASIIEEKGFYNDRSYDMIFDGAMHVNHVALVKEGRCGEGARILDQKSKGKPMKKSAVKDIDMDALLGKVVEKILPDVQKMISSDDFATKLASVIGAGMSNSMYGEEEMDADVEKAPDENGNGDAVLEPNVEKMEDADEDKSDAEDEKLELKEKPEEKNNKQARAMDKKSALQDAAIKAEVNGRIDTIMLAKSVDPKAADFESKSNHTILLDALTPILGDKMPKMANMSEDYLRGVASVIAKKREDATMALDNFPTGQQNGESEVPSNGIRLKAILKKHQLAK